ncbi:MAG: hypothetical protein H6598_09855 [Flavobacteriales bacterium]|nr:hypothetical protein [Flavobacteriales bacterium]
MKKQLLTIGTMLIMSICVSAQETDSIKKRHVQVSFGFPIGSNGIKSMEYSNNLSINVLYGLNGGLNGAEFGSILNYNKGNVNGVQFSGVTNFNNGRNMGVLMAGVSNICTDSTTGLIASGVSNINFHYLKGMQLATTNFMNGELIGCQLGILNYAQKLKGAQIGIINIASDGESVVPIGLFNFVRNGYNAIELTSGESIFANLSFKMGVKKLYTIYKLGYSTYKNNPIYSYGLGFGTIISLTEKQFLNLDLSSNNLVYKNDWNSDLNLIGKLDFNYNYKLNNSVSLLIGPSLNSYWTKVKINQDFGTLKIPYSLKIKEESNIRSSTWIGMNLGIRFNL